MTLTAYAPTPFTLSWRATPLLFRWWAVSCGVLVVVAFALLLTLAPGPGLATLVDDTGFLALVALLVLADLYPAVPWMRGRSAFGELILSSPVAIAALLAFGPHAAVVFLISGCAMNLARGKTWWRILLNMALYGLQGAVAAWALILLTDRIGPVTPGSAGAPWALGLATLVVVLVYELVNLVTVGISVATVGASSWRAHVGDWRPQVIGGVFSLTAPVPAVLAAQLPIMLPVLALASIAALEATNVISSRAVQAGTDSLTGLANRPALTDGIRQRLGRIRTPADQVIVLLADLDRFKQVNDSYGHLAGDQVLAEVARRMETATRAADLVARFGGDEFAILLAPGTGRSGVEDLVARVQRAVAEPMSVDGHALTVGVSLGWASAASSAVDVQDLLEEADAELYRAKAARAEPDDSGPVPEPPEASDGRSELPSWTPMWSVTDRPAGR